VSFTADVDRPRRSAKDVKGDLLTALTEQQMSTRATPCVGYWAAYYINRNGGWSVACDALGRIIRCETEKLALSVARYRRRRLQPFRGGNPNLMRTEKRYGRDSAGRAIASINHEWRGALQRRPRHHVDTGASLTVRMTAPNPIVAPTSLEATPLS
jgi:hypothetical protein